MHPPPPTSYNVRYLLIVYKSSDKVVIIALKKKSIIKLNILNNDTCKNLTRFINFTLKKERFYYR